MELSLTRFKLLNEITEIVISGRLNTNLGKSHRVEHSDRDKHAEAVTNYPERTTKGRLKLAPFKTIKSRTCWWIYFILGLSISRSSRKIRTHSSRLIDRKILRGRIQWSGDWGAGALSHLPNSNAIGHSVPLKADSEDFWSLKPCVCLAKVSSGAGWRFRSVILYCISNTLKNWTQ